MMQQPTNPQRYEAAQPQPVYPPYLMANSGYPAGQAPFPPPEPPNPSMLPGYPTAQSYPTAQPAPWAASPSYAPPAHPQDLSVHERAYAAYHQGRGTQPQPDQAPNPPVDRPAVLKGAVAAGLTASALTVLSQVLALRAGKATIEQRLLEQLPGGAENFPGLIAAGVDTAYRTIQARATLSVGLAVLAAALVAMCLRAGLAARIGATVVTAFTGLLLVVCLLDVYPASARLVGVPALVLFPITAVLLFLPAVGRYRAARAQRRAVTAVPRATPLR